ncbi:MAG: hypothetical protein FJZ56_00475 [Chlamydiae bacterium]|nr:hypothetical protein [Chlamydiota bacterium]
MKLFALFALMIFFTVLHFTLFPVDPKKIETLESVSVKSSPLSSSSEHERIGVERILLQTQNQERVMYQVHYPSALLQFRPDIDEILEKVNHFELSYCEGGQKRYLRGEKAIYDFKKQTLFADHFHLSIYDGNDFIFDGLGSNLRFYFQELSPCFSIKNFTAHLNLEEK